MTVHEKIPYEEIVERLNDHASQIAEDCIPDGRRDKNYWRGDCHGKCSVHIAGPRVGMVGFWQGQAGNTKGGGNLIHLIELAFGCKSHGEAVQIAKERYLELRGRELTPEEKRAWAKSQEASKRRAAERQRQAEIETAEKAETAHAVWHASVPIAGTLAEVHLKGRDIELSDFPDGRPWPPSLRFNPRVELRRGEFHPALVCGVQAPDRKLIAVWRIFLRPDGTNLLDKDGKKIKLGLGPAAGGAVRLAPIGEVLRLAEGVETSIGVLLLTGCRVPVWATLSTSGMIGFQIPKGVRRLEIYADGDRHRLNKLTNRADLPPGIRAADLLQERALKEGVECVIVPSPEPDDWLDVWQTRKKDMRNGRSVVYLD
ncbi:hypothetical protein KL86PLE_90675 [uncultured Pleomorphomonas sp.]|uniref:Uncharacterized protein n=2 Tax=uncultured Pleomorphomonas sp. TaxID=442121 RepID=A0A212LQR7_9HYPH|nr:hypothetical protein KL86PLE_90675 [uncultured Pleomorphomonas sp.]